MFIGQPLIGPCSGINCFCITGYTMITYKNKNGIMEIRFLFCRFKEFPETII